MADEVYQLYPHFTNIFIITLLSTKIWKAGSFFYYYYLINHYTIFYKFTISLGFFGTILVLKSETNTSGKINFKIQCRRILKKFVTKLLAKFLKYLFVKVI